MLPVNWRDEKNYTHTEDHGPRMWAWEFIRRNPDYWQYWEESFALYEEAVKRKKEIKHLRSQIPAQPTGFLGALMGLNPSQPTETQLLLAELLQQEDADITLFDRDVGPEHDFFSISRRSAKEAWGFNNLYSPAKKAPGHFAYDFLMTHDKSGHVFLSEQEIMVRFDLSKKLKPQLTLAEKQVKKAQSEKGFKPVEYKIKKEPWAIYLRVLDAHNSGTARRVAAPIIFHKLGKEAAENAYSNALKRAKEIMRGGYRTWL